MAINGNYIFRETAANLTRNVTLTVATVLTVFISLSIVGATVLVRQGAQNQTRQFENEANPEMHSRTTAQEIVRDFADEKLDYWVTGFGTGGTLTGVGRVLREKMPNTRIIVAEPEGAPMLTSGEGQERRADHAATGSHPAWKPHPFQGWSPDFIPWITNEAVTEKLFDQVLTIAGPDAMKQSMMLAQKEGIFVGITAGATFAAALKVAETAPKGSTILAMLPDTGERYLSTPLFADVPADMSPEEEAISMSTPGQQLPPKVAA